MQCQSSCEAHLRAQAVSKEGYRIAEGFLEHLQNIDGPLRKALDPKVTRRTGGSASTCCRTHIF